MSGTQQGKSGEAELAAALKEIRSDLSSLKKDFDTLRHDSQALGKTSVRAGREAAEDVKDRAKHAVSTVEDDLEAIGADLKKQVQRNPLTALGLGVLGGLFLSAFLRRD